MKPLRFDRRSFLAGTTTALGLSGRYASAQDAAAPQAKKVQGAVVRPTEAQRAWMDLRFGLFVHFGINTYYDTEWSDGTLDPSRYDPDHLDTDQWCRVARAAGMKYLVLVTKHHDGFCNWPTRFTEYSVKATPFRGDLVGEVVKSARKHGLAVGFYYSLWDRHEKTHDTDDGAYVEFMKEQLRELLTGYGEVVELWFDGFWKKQKNGWKGSPAEFMDAWRVEGAYRWQMDHLYQYIKRLQPSCLVMNNSTTAFPGVPLHPVDIRSGEKYTMAAADQKVWSWLGGDVYLPLQIETTMSQKGKKGRFGSGSWFWHEWDDSVASVEKILEWMAMAVKLEANLLLNVGPSPAGRLRPQDEEALNRLATT